MEDQKIKRRRRFFALIVIILLIIIAIGVYRRTNTNDAKEIDDALESIDNNIEGDDYSNLDEADLNFDDNASSDEKDVINSISEINSNLNSLNPSSDFANPTGLDWD